MESRDESNPIATEPSDVQGNPLVGKGIENALKRKERLRQLREQRKRPRPQSSGPHSEEAEERDSEHQLAGSGGKAEDERSSLPKPLFRTYRPTDESLKGLELPDSTPENIDKQVKENLTTIANENVLDRDINIHTLQSHKPDWDIKRGIAKQLDKLDRRTKRAIAELVRERLQANKDAKANLAQAVKVSQPETLVESDED